MAAEKIHCLYCNSLNELSHKHCDHCGMAMPKSHPHSAAYRQKRFKWAVVAIAIFCVFMMLYLSR